MQQEGESLKYSPQRTPSVSSAPVKGILETHEDGDDDDDDGGDGNDDDDDDDANGDDDDEEEEEEIILQLCWVS